MTALLQSICDTLDAREEEIPSTKTLKTQFEMLQLVLQILQDIADAAHDAQLWKAQEQIELLKQHVMESAATIDSSAALIHAIKDLDTVR